MIIRPYIVLSVHILFRQHRNLIIQHLANSASDVEKLLFSSLVMHLDLAFSQSCDHRGVVLQNLEEAVAAWQLHQHCVAAENLLVGCCYLEFHGLLLAFFQHLLSFLDSFLDGANEVESCLWILVNFAVHDHVKALDGVFNLDCGAFQSRELLGYGERL